jgi:hypothetical protein
MIVDRPQRHSLGILGPFPYVRSQSYAGYKLESHLYLLRSIE